MFQAATPPPVYFGGSSDAALDVAARHADVYLSFGEPLYQAKEKIERVRRPTPGEKRYFPSISTQRQAFRLVFPVKHEDGQPALPAESLFALLRFTGPQGQVDLKWEFGR